MDEQEIVLSESSYSNYLESYLKIKILRELLSKTKPYEWENIIRGVLDIPKEESADA